MQRALTELTSTRYESTYFTQTEIEFIYSKKLSNLILENYPSITGFPDNIFFTQERGFQVQSVLFPEPPNAKTLPWRFRDLAPTFRVNWYISSDGLSITFLLQVYTNGWIGIGFSPEPNTMRGADIHRCASDLNPPCSDLRAFDVGLPPFDTARGGKNFSPNPLFVVSLAPISSTLGKHLFSPSDNNTKHNHRVIASLTLSNSFFASWYTCTEIPFLPLLILFSL